MCTHEPMYANRAANSARTVIILAVAATLGVSACGYRSWDLMRDPQLTDGVAGYVVVGKPDGQVRSVEVAVYHMEEPTTLVMGTRSYVVWLYSGKGQKPQNLGALALRLSGDAHSSNGFLRAKTEHSEFRIVVTPEQDAQTEAPHNLRVFWANIESR